MTVPPVTAETGVPTGAAMSMPLLTPPESSGSFVGPKTCVTTPDATGNTPPPPLGRVNADGGRAGRIGTARIPDNAVGEADCAGGGPSFLGETKNGFLFFANVTTTRLLPTGSRGNPQVPTRAA